MTVRHVTPWRESGPILKILSNSVLANVTQVILEFWNFENSGSDRKMSRLIAEIAILRSFQHTLLSQKPSLCLILVSKSFRLYCVF
jgi:hypothetical protein